jgi:hypothetical protein
MTSSSDSLSSLSASLELGMKHVAVFAQESHWSLRNREVVQHRVWNGGPPSAWYEEEMVVDYRAIGWGADLVKQSYGDTIGEIIGSDNRLFAAFATSDYGDDVDRSIRIANASDAFIDDFLVQYLRDSDDFSWNEESFNLAMASVRDFVASNNHSLVVRTPILNFSMNVEELAISNGIVIKRLPSEDVSRLERTNLYQRQNRKISPFHWIPGNFYIEVRAEVPIGADRYDERRDILLKVHECLTAIRLLSDGWLALGDVWFERTSPHFGDIYDDVYVREGNLGVWPTAKLEVDSATPGTIAELISKLSGVWSHDAIKSNPLFIPNSRFNMYYERSLVEDQLLDLAICVEALFSKSDERTEITYRISRRIGRLLGHTQAERIALISRAKDIYNVRSRLVHGGHVETKELFDSVQTLFGIVRDAIVLKIQTGWTVENLDDEMMA